MYTREDVLNFIEEENVRFIRLTFFDVYGKQKNISIQPSEIYKAFDQGISIDGSSVFESEDIFDLYLVPDPSTMCSVPWRSFDGTVIRMYCDIFTADGEHYLQDTRYLLKQAIRKASQEGVEVIFGSKFEFYLFHQKEDGSPSQIPLDYAGYMDIAPEDKGEDVRRQICFYMDQMGLGPKSSHHESGPGQNEIDFHSSPALLAADEAATFKWVVRTVAQANGLYADFSPKPMEKFPGNSMGIKLTINEQAESFIAGILHHIEEMTLFLNPVKESYRRFGLQKAPGLIGYSKSDRQQVIRLLPNTLDGKKHFELRSADNMCNPYIAFMLILYAGLDGIQNHMELPNEFKKLPETINEAKKTCKNSSFIKKYLPDIIIDTYCK
ncbi:MAG: glutamine synthetase family protein [Bacillota bacterium]|nr:glutamine synthetase family protein [Bacillota bacterium]